ncbi:MAG: hypothetical protein Q8L14_34520 [Myxococcales bacterium]|nr:hypothetical protein [Myxococcales bacterium]
MTSWIRMFVVSALAQAATAWSDEAVSTPASTAVERPAPKNVAFMNLGDLATGGISLDYERVVAPWLGLTAGLGMRGFDTPLVNRETWRTTASAALGVRLHLVQRAPAGLFVDAHVTGAALMKSLEGAPLRPFGWGAGASLGYQFVVLPNFAFQLGAGAGFIDGGAGLQWEPRLRVGLGVLL